MDCDRYRDDLLEDDGEHPPALHIRRHLDVCPRCRDLQKNLALGRQLLHSLPPASPSSDFVLRLENRLQAFEQRRRVRRRRFAAVSRAGSAAVAAAAGFLVVFAVLGELDRSSRFGLEGRGTSQLPDVASMGSFSRMLRQAESSLFERRFDRLETLVSHDPSGGVGGLNQEGAVAGERSKPLLYATPSLTFAAAPVSIHLVAAAPPSLSTLDPGVFFPLSESP